MTHRAYPCNLRRLFPHPKLFNFCQKCRPDSLLGTPSRGRHFKSLLSLSRIVNSFFMRIFLIPFRERVMDTLLYIFNAS